MNILKDGVGDGLIKYTAHFEDFPMQMIHIRGASTLMQIVDILCNYMYIKILLQLSKCHMCPIRHRLSDLSAPKIIEIQNQSRILCESFWCSDIFDTVVFAEPVSISKGLQAI